MPRWARFLSCSFTGLLMSLVGFLMTASWWEGGEGYWPHALDFLSTRAFWSLTWLFGLMMAVILLAARLLVNLYGLSDGLAGLLAGGLIAMAYVAFLVASHTADWGGVAFGIQRAWPAGAVFASPFALTGAFTTWLWDRLD